MLTKTHKLSYSRFWKFRFEPQSFVETYLFGDEAEATARMKAGDKFHRALELYFKDGRDLKKVEDFFMLGSEFYGQRTHEKTRVADFEVIKNFLNQLHLFDRFKHIKEALLSTDCLFECSVENDHLYGVLDAYSVRKQTIIDYKFSNPATFKKNYLRSKVQTMFYQEFFEDKNNQVVFVCINDKSPFNIESFIYEVNEHSRQLLYKGYDFYETFITKYLKKFGTVYSSKNKRENSSKKLIELDPNRAVAIEKFCINEGLLPKGSTVIPDTFTGEIK